MAEASNQLTIAMLVCGTLLVNEAPCSKLLATVKEYVYKLSLLHNC